MNSDHERDAVLSAEYVRPAEDAVAKRVGNTMVLIHLQTNLIYELNRTGARLWELIGEGCERSELHHRLLSEFEVDPEHLSPEIDRLLHALSAARLVTLSRGGQVSAHAGVEF
jgi:hypothetical protein